MTDKWVTDDPISADVGVELGMKIGIITKCITDKGEVLYHHATQSNVNIIILFGLEHKYYKAHLELNEFYYHPTDKGLALLDSKK